MINDFFRRQAEQEARRKALIAGMKDKKKRFEVRAYENDGWCKMLQIWRPKATVDIKFIKEKNVKSKWFRDPNTDQDCFMISFLIEALWTIIRPSLGLLGICETMFMKRLKWISRDRVENPRPKEDAPAGVPPAVNAAA